MNRSFVAITTLFDLHISFLSFNWNQSLRPVDRRPEVGWNRVIKAIRKGHARFFFFKYSPNTNKWLKPDLHLWILIVLLCHGVIKYKKLRGRHAEDDLFTHYKQIVQTNLICKPDKKKANSKIVKLNKLIISVSTFKDKIGPCILGRAYTTLSVVQPVRMKTVTRLFKNPINTNLLHFKQIRAFQNSHHSFLHNIDQYSVYQYFQILYEK